MVFTNQKSDSYCFLNIAINIATNNNKNFHTDFKEGFLLNGRDFKGFEQIDGKVFCKLGIPSTNWNHYAYFVERIDEFYCVLVIIN